MLPAAPLNKHLHSEPALITLRFTACPADGHRRDIHTIKPTFPPVIAHPGEIAARVPIRTPPLHPHTGGGLTSHLTSVCHQAHCAASIPAFTPLHPPSHLSVLTPRVTSDGPNLPSPQPLSPPPPSSLALVDVSTPHYKSDGSLSASHQAVGGSGCMLICSNPSLYRGATRRWQTLKVSV